MVINNFDSLESLQEFVSKWNNCIQHWQVLEKEKTVYSDQPLFRVGYLKYSVKYYTLILTIKQF